MYYAISLATDSSYKTWQQQENLTYNKWTHSICLKSSLLFVTAARVKRLTHIHSFNILHNCSWLQSFKNSLKLTMTMDGKIFYGFISQNLDFFSEV